MFEDYLEDAYYFYNIGSESTLLKEQNRHYRAAAFCVASALEAFINYLGDGFENQKILEPYELALLQDKKFSLISGKFVLTTQTEFRRLEEKIKFLLTRFSPAFDTASHPAWQHFLRFKVLRDDITHPRENKDTGIERLERELPKGMNAVIDLIDTLLLGIYGSGLRQKIVELKILV